MKIFSQRRLSYTSINKPLILYSSGIENPNGVSGIYGVRDWPCRKKVRLPKIKSMSKEQKKRELKVCLVKVEVELSKRKVKNMMDEFASEAVNKAMESL